MKNLNPEITKVLLILFLVFTSSISIAQLNFKDSNLAFIEKITLTKCEDIEIVMKESNYELERTSNYGSYHNFYFKRPKSEVILVRYSPSKKFESISITLPYLMGLLSEQELEERKFTGTAEDDGKRWTKGSYAFNFYIKDTENMKKKITLYSN